MSTFLWQKDTKTDDWVTRFTVGEDWRWDTLLLPYDIEATRAHAWGLVQIDILTEEELDAIEEVLSDLYRNVREGEVTVTPEDEDAHTVIENVLTEALGETGKRIHTGRSRNDQVLAALRLFLRKQLQDLGRKTAALSEQLCLLGEKHNGDLMPGYTHLQRAMSTTVGLWAMGYAELLAADLDTLHHANEQINVSPLGSAAGYGVPYLELPREKVAERLGFRGVQTHVTAVQLSRGKLELQVLHALVQLAGTVNRMASDLVLYNTAEFGFVELPDEYCTGSSIMPQKRNPDVMELARAAYHQILADMQLLTTVPANLPSGYHRDLQLTKAAVMRSTLYASDLLTAMVRVTEGLSFNTGKMKAACTPELFATAEALEKVQSGTPFRDAYREAADGADTLAAPDPQEVLDTYQVEGFPGRVKPGAVREKLTLHEQWLHARDMRTPDS